MEPQGSVQEAEPEHQPRVFLGVWYSFHYVLLREWEWERNWLNDWLDRAKSLRISLPDNSPSFPLTNILVCLAWGQSRGKSALGSLCSPMTPTCVLFSLPAHSPPFPCPQSPNILSVCLSVCLSVSFSSPQPCKPCVCVCVRAKSLQPCLSGILWTIAYRAHH